MEARSVRLALALLGALLLTSVSPPSTALAQEPPATPQEAQVDSATRSQEKIQRPIDTQKVDKTVSTREYEARMRAYINSGKSTLSIYQVLQELIDDMMSDTKDLRLEQLSPLTIRGVGVSPNLSPQLGRWVESELTARFTQLSTVAIRYCASCQALSTDVENGEWVLKLGWTSQSDMREAAKKLGVKAFMDAFISFIPAANQVMLNVRIYRADTGTVLWAESYTSDSSTAAILRSGDRVMTREEAYKELTRRIEQRPYYGYSLYFGGGMVPFEGPQGDINFNTVGIRFYEKFGEDHRTLFGIVLESAINIFSNPLMGAFFGGLMQYRVNRPNLNDIQIWAGSAIQFFVAGLQGNTLTFESNLDLIMQFRLGLGISIFYAIPVDFGGFDLGGVGYKFRFTFNF